MGYSSDLLSRFRSPDSLSSAYEILLYSGDFSVISGQKGLLCISDEEIVVRVKGGKVRAYGARLKVDCVSRDEIYLSGKIKGVEMLSDD